MKRLVRIVSVLVLLLTLASGIASSISPLEATEMEAKITFSGTLLVKHTAADTRLNWVEANLFLLPQQTPTQKVQIISVQPSTYSFEYDEFGNKLIKLRWEKPDTNILSYTLVYRVKTNTLFEPFLRSPKKSADDLDIFLQQDTLSGWTPSIKGKAEMLSANSTEGLEISSNIGKWVHSSIHYNEDYWEKSVSAKETFKSYEGVCDEFAQLSMAMHKSMGIPSRYVEGLVYSGKQWDMHAWQEANIGGKWVQLDPTYNEYGVVDPTHIILAKVPNDEFVLNRVQWEGRNVKVEFFQDKKEVEILSTSESRKLIDLAISLQDHKIGKNQKTRVTATLRNRINTPLTPTCRLSVPQELITLDEPEKTIFLKPRSTGTLELDILSRKDIALGWIYTMPIIVSCFPNAKKNITLEVDPKFSGEDSSLLEIEDITVIDSASLRTVIRNKGTINLEDISVSACAIGEFKDLGPDGRKKTSDCKTIRLDSIKPGEVKTLLFEGIDLEGEKTIHVDATSQGFSKSLFLENKLDSSGSGFAEGSIGNFKLDNITKTSTKLIEAVNRRNSVLYFTLVFICIVSIIALLRSIKKHKNYTMFD